MCQTLLERECQGDCGPTGADNVLFTFLHLIVSTPEQMACHTMPSNYCALHPLSLHALFGLL
jgi:hypothetical protein